MMPGFYFYFILFLFLFLFFRVLISKKKKTHDLYPNHEFELKNNPKPYWCDGCRLPAYGPRYSSCDESEYDLHKECMSTTEPPTSHNLICEGLTFEFFGKPPKSSARNRKGYCDACGRYCDACGQAINGFVYYCKEKDWYLHPFCRDLKNEIYIKGEKFQLRDEVSRECRWCKKKTLSNGVKRSWSYLAKKKECLFHVYCVTEMTLENWKKEPKDSNRLELENLELPLQANLHRRGGKGRKYLRTVKFLGPILASILLGDPTIPSIALGSLCMGLVELVSK